MTKTSTQIKDELRAEALARLSKKHLGEPLTRDEIAVRLGSLSQAALARIILDSWDDEAESSAFMMFGTRAYGWS